MLYGLVLFYTPFHRARIDSSRLEIPHLHDQNRPPKALGVAINQDPLLVDQTMTIRKRSLAKMIPSVRTRRNGA